MLRFTLLFWLVVHPVIAAADPVAGADAYLKKMFPADKPGAAVLVVHEGQPVLLEGYGLADMASKKPITPDTAFDLASVSKQFTSMAIMLLAERGKLGYDDEVGKWIAELQAFEAPRPITIRDLLNHTSGLPDYLGVFNGDDDAFAQQTCADVPRMLKEIKLRFPPGAKFEYSNSNYALLPLIVERASGKPFSLFLRDHVFVPLGMHSTLVADAVPFQVPTRATGYSRKMLSSKYELSRKDGPICGDGNVFSTARDFIKWDEALATNRLVRADTLTEAFTPPKLETGKPTDYGFGWSLRTRNGKRMVWHNGGWAGTRTNIVRLLDHRLTVVVLSNDESVRPEKPSLDIVKMFIEPASESSPKQP